MTFRFSRACAFAAAAAATFSASQAFADDFDDLPPFDHSDAFYLERGFDPANIVGRPVGNPPNSIIDNTPNGPDYNNVRILSHAACYDHSGHPMFFFVTGLANESTFLTQEARETAEFYKVYEFPRSTNPNGAAFPKRQDFVADTRNGYFSNDPTGIWQVNLLKYTDAALNTPAGQAALADLAARNGYDLDGTPLIRTMSEVEDLLDDGYLVNFVPPADGSSGLRWFFCPIIEDPRNGVIAPDAFLGVTGEGVLPAAQEFIDLFNCLQQTGDDDCENWTLPGDIDGNGFIDANDRALLCSTLGSSVGDANYLANADYNNDGTVDHLDHAVFNNSHPPCGSDIVSSRTFTTPGDGITDGADLAFLLGAWGNQASCADFATRGNFQTTPDGLVDGADLAYLLSTWGACQ